MPSDAPSPDHPHTEEERSGPTDQEETDDGSFRRPGPGPGDNSACAPGMMRRTFLRCVVFAALGGSFYRARRVSVPPPIDADPGRNTVDLQKKISPRPYCLLAEMGMLGSMLLWPEEVIGDFVKTGVSETWFYRRAHATIYSVLAESWSVRKPCDLITLAEILRERGQLEEVGGPAYIVELAFCVSTADGACHFRNIVCEKYSLPRSLNWVPTDDPKRTSRLPVELKK